MKRGPIINFLIKYKFAKNVKTANGILLIISILNFLITAELLSKGIEIAKANVVYNIENTSNK